VAWIDMELDPRGEPDGLDGVGHHVADAWARRAEPNVLLVHYDELQRDLDATMRRIAGRLAIEVDEATWPGRVAAAGFDAMRARAADAVPDRSGVVRSADRFFRRGVSGARFEELSPDEIARYDARMATLVPPDALAWLHGGG
jgi:hypothetical protein